MVVSIAVSPLGSRRTLAATPRPSPTTIAVLVQPSTTWRAVTHTPLSATEKAVPASGSVLAGALTTTDGSKGVAGPSGSPSPAGIGGGGGGALARSCRPSAATVRATT